MTVQRKMHKLSSAQNEILSELVEKLSGIKGVESIALGGSYARGRARPDSDTDAGSFYCDDTAFAISEIRSVSAELDDEPDPVVTGLGEWGPWVSGGAWLTIRGQRVDFLYRSLDRVDRVILEAEEGKHELHYGQQPPFGFLNPTYLGKTSLGSRL